MLYLYYNDFLVNTQDRVLRIFYKILRFFEGIFMDNTLLLPTNLLCGYFDCTKFGALKLSPKRITTLFEIEYFLEDGANTYSDEIAYPIRRNWVRICTPGEERYSELPFKTKYVKFSAEGKLADLLRAAPPYFCIYRTYEALALLDEIIALSTASPANEILLHGKLFNYIALILEESGRSQNVEAYKNKLTLRAQNFIHEHYSEPIRLSDIAKSVNLSPNYFHTLFTEVAGCTPHTYLERHRVEIAKKLLITTHLSLSEIAERCGFKTQQYLSSIFKAHLLVSPNELRRQHQSAYLTD